jgi:hypothetical protein
MVQAIDVLTEHALQLGVAFMVKFDLEALILLLEFAKVSFQHAKPFAQDANALFDLGLNFR